MNASDRLPLLKEESAHQSRVEPRPPGRGAVLLLVLALAAALGWGAYAHWERSSEAATTQAETLNFVPTVRTTVAKLLDGPLELTLPGTALSFDQARIYARASGYVAERRVDIGSRVHKGDLLARIAAPELDQQLVQAEAQLGQQRAALEQAHAAVEQSRSNATLADVTNSRTARLAGQGWETKQAADNTRLGLAAKQADLTSSEAGVRVAEANLRAQAATVQRLQQLIAYERIEAPFDGVITSRGVDTGDLVGAEANSGTPLFTVQRDDVLRVQVNVPQSGAIGLHPGLKAKVRVPELPGRSFEGELARSSVALDPNSRTMLVQVDVPNPSGELKPGLYVLVDFAIPRASPAVVIPAEALMFNSEGTRVAMLDDQSHVHLVPVTIYRDLGTTLELRSGLKGGERLAVSVPADIADGQTVRVAPAAETAQK